MIVTTDILAGLRTGYNVIFQQALGELAGVNQDWAKIASEMPSTTDRESYNWLGAIPAMSEWKDVRQLNDLRDWDYTLVNKHWEATLQVDRDALSDDKYGMIKSRIRSLARAYLKKVTAEVFSQLDDGETLTAFDGSAFFADTRVIGASANIDNLLSGAYSASATEVRSGLAAAVSSMRNFQDDQGNPMNLMPDTVVCGPEMEILIKEALLPGVAGTRRPEMDYVKTIVVSPWIDLDQTDWYCLCTSEEVKPVILQNRQAPEFVSLDDPKGERAFIKRQFLYGVDARFVTGFGDPRTAIKLKDA
jgi:phage major head subunit gpT-like protein